MSVSSTYTDEQLTEFKLRFAAASIQKPDEAHMIVAKILGDGANPFHIISFADYWPIDPVVVAEKERLLAIPLQINVIVKELHSIAKNIHVENKDRISAYKVIGELMGWGGTTSAAKGKLKSVDKLAELAAMVNGPDDDEVKPLGPIL